MRVFRGGLLHFVGIGGVAVLAGFLLLLFFFALVVFLFGIAGAVLAHFQRFEQLMHDVAELALILDQTFQAIEISAGALLDQRPPEFHQFARGWRRCETGEPFAHHQSERLLDRRVGAIGNVVEFAAMKAIVEHGGEIERDAIHAARADGFDAGLLDGFEHRACLLAVRLQLAMDDGVVTGDAQRDRVGIAAHDGRFGFRQFARRLRQPRLAAQQAGPFGGVGHFEIGLARQSAQSAGDRPLERLGRRFLGRGFRFARV